MRRHRASGSAVWIIVLVRRAVNVRPVATLPARDGFGGVGERIDFDRHIAPMIADLGRILPIGPLAKQAAETWGPASAARSIGS